MIKSSGDANSQVLLLVRVEPPNWTAVPVVGGGEKDDAVRPPANDSDNHQAVPKQTHPELTHTHTQAKDTHARTQADRHTCGERMEFCFPSR